MPRLKITFSSSFPAPAEPKIAGAGSPENWNYPIKDLNLRKPTSSCLSLSAYQLLSNDIRTGT
jgi:hypothetical protein